MSEDRVEKVTNQLDNGSDPYMGCRVHQAFCHAEDSEEIKCLCECPISCPVDSAMSIFEGKWNVKVLFVLFTFHTMRFGEIQRSVDGISKTMLSSTLKFLETKGLVKRIQFNEIPPHVEYSLTEAGEALKSVFVEIGTWSARFLPKE